MDWWIRDGGGGIRRINVEKGSLGDGHDVSIQKYIATCSEDDIAFQHGRKKILEKPGRILFSAQSASFNLIFDETLQQRWFRTQTETDKENPYRWVGTFDDTESFMGSVGMSLDWINLRLRTPEQVKYEFVAISVLQERKFWWQRAELNSPLELGKRLFNVMLIGRRDDIAHRLGIWKIYIDDWLAADPVSKVIVLE